MSRDLPAIERLIQGGADINSDKIWSNGKNTGLVGKAPLLAALDLSDRRPLDLTLIRFLLDNGARVDVRDQHGRAPLELALANRSEESLEAAQLITARGADVNADGGRALTSVVSDGEEAKIEFLLKLGANPNAAPPGVESALHAALNSRPFNMPVIEALLKAGADPNHNNESGQLFRALARVGRMESLDIADKLLRAGAKLDVKVEGAALLLLATLLGDERTVREMLDRGVSPDAGTGFEMSALRMISRFGNWRTASTAHVALGQPAADALPAQLLSEAAERDTSIVRLLLAKGADPTTGLNRFALLDAAEAGNVPLTRLLLERGAPVNISDRELLPLLAPGLAGTRDRFLPKSEKSSAVKAGRNPSRALSTPEAEAVLQRWVDAYASTPEKYSSARRGSFEVAHQLASLPLGRTPLLAAAINGHADIVTMLLEHKADVHARNRWGQTPLLAVANLGRSATVRFLPFGRQSWTNISNGLKAGNLQASYEYELWQLRGWKTEASYSTEEEQFWKKWSEGGDGRIVQVLLASGADVNARDLRGKTALHHAAHLKHAGLVEALIKAGASINALDELGRTPLIQLVADGRRHYVDKGASVPLIREISVGRGRPARALTPEEEEQARLKTDDHLQRRAEWTEMMTALRSAAIADDISVARLLLKAGADPSIKDKTNLTAGEWAERTNYSELSAVLDG